MPDEDVLISWVLLQRKMLLHHYTIWGLAVWCVEKTCDIWLQLLPERVTFCVWNELYIVCSKLFCSMNYAYES